MSKLSYLHSTPAAPYQYCSLNDVIKQNADDFPNREAFVYRSAHGARQSITFIDLYDKARCVAQYLISSGVKKQDTVGLFGPNTISRIVAEFGILLSGAVVLQLNIDVKNASDAVDILNKSKCRVVFADPGDNNILLPVIRNLENKEDNVQQQQQFIFLRESSSTEIAHALINDVQYSDDTATVLPVVYPEDDAIIFTTSGSTGKPKMVVHSHFSFTIAIGAYNQSIGESKKDYNDRPFCWLGGTLAFPTIMRTTLVFTDSKLGATGNGVKSIWKIIAEEKVDMALLMPYYLHDLIVEQDNIEDDGFRLETIATGGQIIDHRCTQVLGRFSKALSVGYGSTEVIGVSVLPGLHLGDHLETGNVGKPLNGVEVRIVGADGQVMPIAEEGEIQVRSSFLMQRYHADEATTDNAFTNARPNWFRMGDIGLITSSGDLIVRGRVKENISRGGRKVQPGVVDDVVQRLKGLRLVATVAVPDARMYEEVCVCYVAKDEVVLSPLDVQRYCEDNISKVESSDGMGSMPKYFVRFDEFPFLFTGKIDKQELKRRAAERLNLPVR